MTPNWEILTKPHSKEKLKRKKSWKFPAWNSQPENHRAPRLICITNQFGNSLVHPAGSRATLGILQKAWRVEGWFRTPKILPGWFLYLQQWEWLTKSIDQELPCHVSSAYLIHCGFIDSPRGSCWSLDVTNNEWEKAGELLEEAKCSRKYYLWVPWTRPLLAKEWHSSTCRTSSQALS